MGISGVLILDEKVLSHDTTHAPIRYYQNHLDFTHLFYRPR